MTSSSHRKASSILQRFNDYLSGLREEFEHQLNATSTSTNSLSSGRFGIYLGNLEGEFKLMGLEIESLQKERDEYREKVERQANELRGVRSNIICARCGKEMTNNPQVTISPQIVKSPSSSSATRCSIQRMPLIRKLRSTIKATELQASPFAIRPDSSRLEERDWTIKFNHRVEKELDVEMAHELLHGGAIEDVKFSRDGKYFAVACKDGKAYIYNVQTGTLTSVLRNLLKEEDHITAVCFSPDGKYLAVSSTDKRVYIWEITNKYVRKGFKGHNRWILSLDFSPNGRRLVSASDDNTVRVWNLRDGVASFLTEGVPTFFGDSDEPRYCSAVFSPDGRHIAACHYDGIVRIWEMRTGRLMRRVMAHTDWATDIAFMPDGESLISGGGFDKTLKFWDTSSLNASGWWGWEKIHDDSDLEKEKESEGEFSTHEDLVLSIAISPDGRWVASGSADQSIRIWDTRNMTMQCILNDTEVLSSVTFCPAGHLLASGGSSGYVVKRSEDRSHKGEMMTRSDPRVRLSGRRV